MFNSTNLGHIVPRFLNAMNQAWVSCLVLLFWFCLDGKIIIVFPQNFVSFTTFTWGVLCLDTAFLIHNWRVCCFELWITGWRVNQQWTMQGHHQFSYKDYQWTRRADAALLRWMCVLIPWVCVSNVRLEGANYITNYQPSKPHWRFDILSLYNLFPFFSVYLISKWRVQRAYKYFGSSSSIHICYFITWPGSCNAHFLSYSPILLFSHCCHEGVCWEVCSVSIFYHIQGTHES